MSGIKQPKQPGQTGQPGEPNEPHEPNEPGEPKWDAADPYGSFLRYAGYLHAKARFVFLTDKTHVELIFIFHSKGEIGLSQVPTAKRKEFLANLRSLIHSNPDVIGIIHIAEAWTRLGSPGDHITKQLCYGEMKVSDLRPEDRGEALMVSLQTRNGLQKIWVEPIIREDGAVSLGKGFGLDQTGGGMGNLFQ